MRDLVSSPEDTFSQVLDVFGTDIDRTAVRSAVARASFENLQGLEIRRRTRKGAVAPPADALRFRRGLPGTHRTELAEADVAYLDKVIGRHLDPIFARYRQPST